jgi:polyisoprenyl-phosphate glycosyltransferase
MLILTLDGITSFSTVPLQIITIVGFIVFVGTVIISGWVMWVKFFTDGAVPGWASTVLPMYFLGGVQLLCVGVIGAYLGRICGEIKSRPRYFIDRTIRISIPEKPVHEIDLATLRQ